MNTDWIQTEFLIYAAVVAALAVGLVYLIQSWRQKRQNAQSTRRVSFEDESKSTQRVRFYIGLFVIVFVGAYLYFYTNQTDSTNAPDAIPDASAYPDNSAPSSSLPEEGFLPITQTNAIIQEGSSMEGVPQPMVEAPMEVEAPKLEMELPTHAEGSVGRESIEKMSPLSVNSRKHTPKFRRGLVPF